MFIYFYSYMYLVTHCNYGNDGVIATEQVIMKFQRYGKFLHWYDDFNIQNTFKSIFQYFLIYFMSISCFFLFSSCVLFFSAQIIS